jgi:hypothetical protein
MIFVGYSDKYKAWKCYNPVTKQIVCSSNVNFDNENIPWHFTDISVPETALLKFCQPLNSSQDEAFDQGEVLINDLNPISETGEVSDNYDTVNSEMESPERETENVPEVQSPERETENMPEVQSPEREILNNETQNASEQSSTSESIYELEKVYQTNSYGKWKYVDSDNYLTKWDSSNLPEPGSKRNRTSVLSQNKVNFLSMLSDIKHDLSNQIGSMLLAANINEAPTFAEAMESKDRLSWKQAIMQEYTSLFEKEVFSKPCKLPKGHKILDTKIVLKLKEAEAANIPRRFKARLCARGFKQEEGIDFDFTFAPVAAYNSVRMFVTILATLDYEIDTVDIVTAFLHSSLKENIYIDIPDGYPNSKALKEQGLVLQLLKCLYGLKQSPREWNQELDSFLQSMGFRPCESEPCIYVNTKEKQYLLVYVDDIIIGAKTKTEMEDIKKNINNKFPITDKGPISKYLNMSFSRNRKERTIFISQPSKIDKLLNDVRLTPEEKQLIRTPTKLPACPNTILTKTMCASTESEITEMKNKPYKSILGQALFISITCRPDIATAVSNCGKYAQNPGVQHWKALLKIITYLNTTRNLLLQLGGIATNLTLNAYSDADWGGDLDNRRSRTGFVVLLNSSPIIWLSKLQLSPALSSTEAEYIALSICARDVIWSRNLMNQLGFAQENPTRIYEDNASCIKIAESRKQLPGTKHVAIRYHFIRYQIESGTIILQQTPTADMIADTLTKALPLNPFLKHRKAFKIVDVESRGSVRDA